MNSKYSSISEFYNGKSVFVTGGTGFLGKVITEKLLRSCEGIQNVYLLVRSKRGKTASERFVEFVKSPAFDLIKEQDPEILNKIILIEGDITKKELGISRANQELLSEKVSVIINSAATINFDEVLKVAIYTNLRSLRELIRLSRNMKHLESFVHISTSYSNWFEYNVEEKFYPTKFDPHAVIYLCESLSDESLAKIQPILLEKHVNTYTFSKALAENLAFKEAQDLPFAIVRPSAVCPSIMEPKVGWIDSYTALVPFIDTIQAGIFRSGLISKNNNCDAIPVDMVTNLVIAVSWKVANDKTMIQPPSIYHSSSSSSNLITFEEMYKLTIENAMKYPPSYLTWMPQLRYHKSKLADKIDRFFTGRLFAYLMDFLLLIFLQKPQTTRIYKKIIKIYDVLSFAHTQPVNILSKNYKELKYLMNESDQKEFYFDPASINWKQYNQDICFGTRKYIRKENENPLNSTLGKRKMKIINIIRFALNTMAASGLVYGLTKADQYFMN